MSFALLYQVSYAPSVLPYVAIVALAGTGTALYFKYKRERSDALRKLATKRGLAWLGNGLPGAFPRKILDEIYCGWLVPRWSSPHNVIGGDVGEDFLLSFDITVAKEDTSYQRTIVAIRSTSAKTKSTFAKGYMYRQCGEWHLAMLESSLAVVSRLIEPAVIEKLWDQLR